MLIVCPYPPGGAPCQRFRYEQYMDRLSQQGIDFDTQSFLDAQAMRFVHRPGHFGTKLMGVVRGFARRIGLLFRARRYDFVFLHREASPIGPPLIEWALFTIGCKVIYDFDDAIFMTPRSTANPFMAYVRCAWKVAYITRRAHMVSVCNPFLADWAKALNPRLVLIPTTIDEEYHRSQPDGERGWERPIVGWTGSHSTARYLDVVRPALAELQRRYDFEFRVICDHDPGFPELKNYRFVKWRLESEIEDLSAFQIGLMPVPEEEWAHGKVGFKAIQYSGLGIASVVSALGSGAEVVVDGETGFTVENDSGSWVSALEKLLRDPNLVRQMGNKARQFILSRYSVRANIDNYLRLFEER